MNIIHTLEQEEIARLSAGKTIPEFRAGDTVSVLVNVIEGSRKRTQAYEGVVIAKRSATVVSTAPSSFARFRAAKVLNVRSSSTRRRLLLSKSSAAATCVVPSFTTCVNVPARLLASANCSCVRKPCRLLLNNFSRTHEREADSSAFVKPREVICFAGLFCV